MPADLSRPERLQIMLSAEELSTIDDWRFQKRMPSRAAAIRELINRGLSAEGFEVATAGRPSSSFGIVDTTNSGDQAHGNSNGSQTD